MEWSSKPWLLVWQAAALVGVTEGRIRALRQERKIRGRWDAEVGRWYIDRESLLDWHAHKKPGRPWPGKIDIAGEGSV